MSEVSTDEVRRVALLARLSLSDTEASAMGRELGKILDYVHKLSELDTSQVEPTSHAVAIATQFRDDEVRPSMALEVAFKNAPERLGDGFGVPKIIE